MLVAHVHRTDVKSVRVSVCVCLCACFQLQITASDAVIADVNLSVHVIHEKSTRVFTLTVKYSVRRTGPWRWSVIDSDTVSTGDDRCLS